MKILVWGAGAVGGTIGAYLARAGHDVTFVDRAADHVAAMNAAGLSITGPVDTFSVRVSAFLPETISGWYDAVLLCVKAQDTQQAVLQLQAHLKPDSYVVSVQNGLNELTISDIIGRERTIGAFVNFGADYIEPGVIQRGNRAAVVLGELDGAITDRITALHRIFLDFDDRAIITQNIWGYLWSKLAYGALLFATALSNESIAGALALPQCRNLYIALAHEVLQVAQARGITPESFNGFDPHAFMPGVDSAISARSLDDMVTFNRGSAKTHSGIWRDLAVRKRRTEVDQQLGPVVALGAEVGIDTPLVARLIELIHDIEDGKRTQSIETLEHLERIS